MLKTLLTIIITVLSLALVGAAVVLVIMFSSGPRDAYNAITAKQATVDFKTINSEAITVKAKYNTAGNDEYSTLVAHEMDMLQTSINYYLELLPAAHGFNGFDKDNLTGLYDNYIKAVTKAKHYLDYYFTFFNSPDTSTSLIRQNQIPGLSAGCIKNYNKALSEGGKFFKALSGYVNNYAYKNKLDYMRIYYDMCYVYSKQTFDFVNTNMSLRASGGTAAAVSTNTAAANFNKLYGKAASAANTAKTADTNAVIVNFAAAYNEISFENLVIETNYYADLSKDKQASADVVKSYLTGVTAGDKFGLSI